MRRRRKPTTLPIGTISSGTLRLEDLIPALISALEDLRLTKAERKTINAVRRMLADDRYFTNDWPQDVQTPDEDYDELTQIADSHVPDYCYFGSTEGDGAEIGVWPVHDDDDYADVPDA